MFYGRDTFKFVLIGAGSSVFTMRLVGDILKEDAAPQGCLSARLEAGHHRHEVAFCSLLEI